MAARGLVNGRDPRSGRDLVFRCYPPELLLTPPKKTEADLLGQPLFRLYIPYLKSSKTFDIEDIPPEFAFKSLNLDHIEDLN